MNEALRKPTLVVKDIGHQISGAGGDGGNSNNIASTTTSITTYNSIKINKNDPALDSAAVYDTLNKPETFFSICLGQPRVSVEFSVERAHLHVFEVTLVQKKRYEAGESES